MTERQEKAYWELVRVESLIKHYRDILQKGEIKSRNGEHCYFSRYVVEKTLSILTVKRSVAIVRLNDIQLEEFDRG